MNKIARISVTLGLALGASLVSSLVTSFAFAQSVQVLGDFRSWSAYTANDGGGIVCFAVTKPTETQNTPDSYGEAHFYVTHRPAEGTRYEINLIAGYTFGIDTTAQLKVGGNSFDMYTQGDGAWLADVSISADVAGAIRAGSSMQIEGTDSDGTRVVQVFSLSGATAAQRAIDGAC